jgi:hypothetical protein
MEKRTEAKGSVKAENNVKERMNNTSECEILIGVIGTRYFPKKIINSG